MSPLSKLLISICSQSRDSSARYTPSRFPTAFPSAVTSRRDDNISARSLNVTTSYHVVSPITTAPTATISQTAPLSLFPSSLEFDHLLNRPLDKEAVELMEDGFAKGTIGNYASALNSYTKFCDDHGIAEKLRFPAEEKVVCAFATSLNKNVSGSTAKTIFTGLKRWHDMHHVEWKGSERVTLMVRGIKNNAPPESKRPVRPAVTPKMLTDLHNSLDHTDPKDVAILACAKVAFFGQARLGELLASARLNHNPSTHPSRNSVIILLNNNAREIKLPSTKTDQADGESIYLTRQTDPLDPVQALENHFRVNHGLQETDHIFAYRSSVSCSGRHSLIKEDFLKRINEVWSALGYQKYTGHSFRIGGTTTLLRNGVPPDVVKELGRWSSDSFLRYWRDVPEIAARHVEFLHIADGTQVRRDPDNTGQARQPRHRAPHHERRNRLQGRPAYSPY